jgi:hypothetical protein
MPAPDKLRIPSALNSRDEYVGRCRGAEQFLALLGVHDGAGRRWELLAHQFDAEGNYLGSRRRWVGDEAGRPFVERCLGLLGIADPQPGDIFVKLFVGEGDGAGCGLFYGQGEVDDGEPYEFVMLEPNDLMFHPPWDSGRYST